MGGHKYTSSLGELIAHQRLGPFFIGQPWAEIGKTLGNEDRATSLWNQITVRGEKTNAGVFILDGCELHCAAEPDEPLSLYLITVRPSSAKTVFADFTDLSFVSDGLFSGQEMEPALNILARYGAVRDQARTVGEVETFRVGTSSFAIFHRGDQAQAHLYQLETLRTNGSAPAVPGLDPSI